MRNQPKTPVKLTEMNNYLTKNQNAINNFYNVNSIYGETNDN